MRRFLNYRGSVLLPGDNGRYPRLRRDIWIRDGIASIGTGSQNESFSGQHFRDRGKIHGNTERTSRPF